MSAARLLKLTFTRKAEYGKVLEYGGIRRQHIIQFAIIPELHQKPPHQVGADVFLPVTGQLCAPGVGILLLEGGLVFDNEKAPLLHPLRG